MLNEISNIITVNQYILDHKEQINIELGSAIKKCRLEKNMSIEEIADKTMTSRSYIAQIENGKNGLSLTKFLVLCNALEVNADEILESFLYGSKKNEDILFYELQKEKNISKNISNYLKKKE